MFTFGDGRGLRYTTSANGAPLQDTSYAPFGSFSSTLEPSDPRYTTEQWNGGDALAAFGVVHLGARLYDPITARFLSRDPIEGISAASKTNPYAFAANDPVNARDPTGLICVDNSDGGYCTDDGEGYDDGGTWLAAAPQVSQTGGFASTTYRQPVPNRVNFQNLSWGGRALADVSYSTPGFDTSDLVATGLADPFQSPPPPPAPRVSALDEPWKFGPPFPSVIAMAVLADDPDHSKYGALPLVLMMSEQVLGGLDPGEAIAEDLIIDGDSALGKADAVLGEADESACSGGACTEVNCFAARHTGSDRDRRSRD